ncbi:MAG: AAA family ATPase [Thermosynechococcaceae cyanobacterium]
METPLPELIQEMCQPGFYDHPVTEPIGLLQTHISYVFLTGDYAYKVKKSVNFGFLDFSDPEKRRYFCQEELRLNRRLSPDLYLAVVPIVQDAGHYRFARNQSAPVSAVDYAVQMRQFPQDMLLSRLFQDNQLTPQMIQALGQLVAAFHRQADTNPQIQTYGSVDAIGQVDANNYALSEPFIGHAQTQQQNDETRAFTTQFRLQHTDALTQRQRAGKIRECHGDLHLNNVCLYNNKIQIFDCIEFSPAFRNIDTIYDMAFMVMDLAFHGRIDLANLFLNTYLEETGDYEGAGLLPLYLCMRAYIRGNVNALSLKDRTISTADKADLLRRSQAYYHLAWRYAQRSPGRLLMMSGVSGSGKSTIARQLAQSLNAIHIRSDAVRKHLAGIPLQQRGDQDGASESGIYTPEMTHKTYTRLLELGLFLAQQGFVVILDAKYDRQVLRQGVLEAAAIAHIPIHIVQCVAPTEVLRDRLQTRTGDITDATADLLETQLATAEPLTDQEQAIATIVRTADSVDCSRCLESIAGQRIQGDLGPL